ncbi:MAG: hypothetical protein M1503_03170 [Thaumarchaeota archaeon]|nr:hypothetical protein [Nitrososphaerota archaeon]MCL5317253.1 hypothetical protein [Nitrososphaerota archaeon]
MSRYVASINLQWQDYTERHKEVRNYLEQRIKEYLDGKKVNPIAIRGGIGQGKTQLLYHAFRYTWENGGIALYTTLDRLLPQQDLPPNTFAEHVDTLVQEELVKFQTGSISTMVLLTDDMKAWLESQRFQSNSNCPVILVDEMERSYRQLLTKVPTDDRSPLGYWLEHTKYLPIGAFAPLSHYEILYGEAERRRWDTVTLQPINATVLRQREGSPGNLVWWLSRGRLGISYKAGDVISKQLPSSYKEFEEAAQAIGSVAEVPAADLDVLASISNTSGALKYVAELFPHEQQDLTHLTDGQIVQTTEVVRQIKSALKDQGWDSRSIEFFGYYLNIITDALSMDGKFLLPDSHEEFWSLFKLAMDLAVETETSENETVRKILDKTSDLEEGGKFPLLYYTGLFQRLRRDSNSRGSVLSYTEVSNLFPMPITSPSFGGISPAEARDILLSKQKDAFLGTDLISTSRGTIKFLYFINPTKMNEYLSSGELLNFIPPHMGVVCILLGGDTHEIEPNGVAAWLKENGRLRIESPSKAVLGDFLACFSAWALEKGVKGSTDTLTGLIEKQIEELGDSEKELGRKAAHYLKMLTTFLELSLSALLLDQTKFSTRISKDAVVRYGTRYKRFADVVGLAFIDSKQERELVYRFRKLLQDSKELKELRSGISGMLDDVSYTAKKDLAGPLQNIRADYEPLLQDLKSIAHYVSEDDFCRLAEDTESKTILIGIYRFVRTPASLISLTEARTVSSKIISNIESLAKERENLADSLNIKLQPSASERNYHQITELDSILGSCSDASPFIQHLLADFAKQVLTDFEDEYLHKDQTTLSKWQGKTDTATTFKQKLEVVKTLSNELYEWLGVTREQVLAGLEESYKKSIEALTRYNQQVDWDNVDGLEWTPYEEGISGATDMIQQFVDLDTDLKRTLALAKEINVKLKQR